jgi:Zn-dependent peptidase ImmA (M78 family)
MSAQYQELPRERFRKIGGLASTVANDYFPDDQIDPLPILRARGITWSFGDYGDTFDGLLECRNEQFHVYCNTDRCGSPFSVRSRFTLSHELGHYFIDEHRRALLSGRVAPHTSFCEFESRWRAEREADFFATRLLMPPHRFAEKTESVDEGLDGVLDLKEHFGTSITSTAIRYVKHDPMPCAVIKWKPEGYGWRWISQSMYEMGLSRTMDEIEEVPRDSATAQALEDTPPNEGRYHQRGGTASFWFPSRQHGAGDAILWEQAVSLGQFGALTLLYPDSTSQSSAAAPR